MHMKALSNYQHSRNGWDHIPRNTIRGYMRQLIEASVLTSHQPERTNSSMTDPAADNLVRDSVLTMVNKREYPKTCCPSEVARAFTAEQLGALNCSDWRSAMDQVRAEAYQMYAEGLIQVTQKGEKVDLNRLHEVKGPIRLRKPA